MNWVAKIIKGTSDEFVHAKLVKYGIGTHVGPRAKIKLSKNRITFKADLDQEKTFLRCYLKGVPSDRQRVKGLITTYEDRRAEFANIQYPIEWKTSKGKGATTYKAKLNEQVPTKDVMELLEMDNPTTFFLLSMSPGDAAKPWKIATKTSFPKAPSGKDEGEKDPTFVKGALANTPEVFEFLIDELLPDFKDQVNEKTKNVGIWNGIQIDEIEIPDDPSLSFREKRKLAKKSGKIVRRVLIDDQEYLKEYPFKA